MSTETAGRRVLCVAAHPDDSEMMAGGTLAKWAAAGATVRGLTLSDGSWTTPFGQVARDGDAAIAEELAAAGVLGMSVENVRRRSLSLQFTDELVCEVLRRVQEWNIDTLICPWDRDLHHDHEVVSRIAVAASRRVPTVLMGQINHHLREVFQPNVFVDITSTWEKKLEALRCFKTEWQRAGREWSSLLETTSQYYGSMVGVERAEGFRTHKFLL